MDGALQEQHQPFPTKIFFETYGVTDGDGDIFLDPAFERVFLDFLADIERNGLDGCGWMCISV